MSRRRADGRKRGFWATWTLPLVGGPLITLACGIALLMTFGEGPGPGATAGNFGLRASTEVPASAAEARMETVAAVSRNVTPPGVTPGPLVEGPLKRIEPPKPVTVERGEPTDTFRRIVVLDGGHFRVVHKGQALVVRLAGIKSPAFDETCRDSAGVEWKCGSKARAELARLIGGRSLQCSIVETADPQAPAAWCAVGPRDLSAWMVENGWADPETEDKVLTPLAAAARDQRRGRFGPAPLGVIAG